MDPTSGAFAGGCARDRTPRRPKGHGNIARKKYADPAVEADVASLDALSHAELKRRFEDLYGSTGPTRMSRKLLRLAVAYRIQEQAYGGLDRRTRRRLDRITSDLAEGRPIARAAPNIKPGTRLLREWNGALHEVTVLEDGVEYDGQTWPSLSAVAREITGTRWSGPRFFGLKGT